MGYHLAGFDVTGVDNRSQPRYPFTFLQADAFEYLEAHGHEYDAIHASPPCQNASLLTRGNRGRRSWSDTHIDLIAPTRALLDPIGRPYVIENVVGAALRPDLILCGLMFGLRVFRHRLFEISGFAAVQPSHPTHRGHRVAGWRHGVRHDGDMVAVYGGGGGKGSITDWQQALGIDWTDDRRELAEAVPPRYMQAVGDQLISRLAAMEAAP
jgi:hypothetical protein